MAYHLNTHDLSLVRTLGSMKSILRLNPVAVLGGVCILVLTMGAGQQSVESAKLSSLGEPPSVVGSASSRLRVEQSNLRTRLVLTGELVAENASVAIAPAVGIWPLQIRWVAENGSEVDEGDRIMEFDNSQLTSRLEDQRSKVVEAQSRLDQASARASSALETARLDLQKKRVALRRAEIEADLPEGLTSAKQLAEKKRDLDRSLLELKQSETTVQARTESGAASSNDARLSFEDAKRDLTRIEAYLDQLVLRSPRTGVLVLSENFQDGHSFRAGDQAWPGMIVARVPDPKSMIVRARLFDVDDGKIEAGMRAKVQLDAFADSVFPGTVRRVDPIAQPVEVQSDRRAFHVVIDVPTLEVSRTHHGMSVKVSVESKPMSDVLTVPRASLSWFENSTSVRLESGADAPVVLGSCDAFRCVLTQGPTAGTALGLAP